MNIELLGRSSAPQSSMSSSTFANSLYDSGYNVHHIGRVRLANRQVWFIRCVALCAIEGEKH